MSAVIQAPREMIEAVAGLRLPAKADHRLQDLMDRNNEGTLTPAEREDLEAFVELSETISLVRAKALQLLGQTNGLNILSGKVIQSSDLLPSVERPWPPST